MLIRITNEGDLSMLDFLFDLLSGMGGVNTGGLNTKKIDKNIEQLKQQEWFEKIYEDKEYHRLFYTNKHVRSYLQSSIRVKIIIRNNKGQGKLMSILDKQLKQ